MTEMNDVARAERELVEMLDRKGILANRDRVRRELSAGRRERSHGYPNEFFKVACALPLVSRARVCTPQIA